MNKICKEYISDAKKFFPIMRKKERAYLRGIVSELEDCIERENISSKQELYTKYRQPYDLANDYYSRFETDEIVKKISVSKYIKILVVLLISIIVILTTVFICFWSEDHITSTSEKMVSNNDSLVDNETYGNIEKNEGGDFLEDDEIIE